MTYRNTITVLLLASCISARAQTEIDRLRKENAELRRRISVLINAEADPWSALSGQDEYLLTNDFWNLLPPDQSKAIAHESERAAYIWDASPSLQMEWNPAIDSAVDMLSGRNRKSMSYALGRYAYWYPYFSKVFSQHGIPDEVTCLCIVESAVNPTAVSPAGAAGMWQLMPATARSYGLMVDDILDERFDIEKSTLVAARVLKDLHKTFNSWPLAVMAYNCGAGNVRKAIIQSGSTDIWTVWGSVPHETQLYLPYLLAASYLSAYGESMEGIRTIPYAMPSCELIPMTHDSDFPTINAVLGFDLDKMRRLNPQYISGIIPKGATLKLPKENAEAFRKAQQDNKI